MNTTHRINSDLDSAAQNIANHLASAATLANGITQRVLSLPDDELALWLNSRTPEETLAMFTSHGQLGDAINAAGTVATATLVQWGLERAVPQVDVRPVPEKLAEQMRTIDLTETGWQVTRIAPPAPEPTEDPQPE